MLSVLGCGIPPGAVGAVVIGGGGGAAAAVQGVVVAFGGFLVAQV